MKADMRWWFVSDLHLSPDEPAPRRTGEAFTDFLGAVVLADDSPTRHLVLLGDIFNLREPEAAGPVEIEAIAARYQDLFAALRTCVAEGVTLDFVCGNHDSALARASVRTALGRLAGRGAGDDRVRAHPWILYAPGVFYAEHGHQHHAVHRQPAILLPDPVRTPLAAWAEHGLHPPARAGAILRAVGAVRHAERVVPTAGYARLLDKEAVRIGLSADALRALARISRFRPVPAAVAVAGRVLARSMWRDHSGAYLESAVAEVHRTLTEHGCAVPWYLFGHTHRALCALVEDGDSRYLNTGTWSADVRGRGPDSVDTALFPVATIGISGQEVRGWLRYWRWSPHHQGQHLSGSGVRPRRRTPSRH
jgi:UDP-2,3-diacylglucosamine pyrophosphatase LpxH